MEKVTCFFLDRDEILKFIRSDATSFIVGEKDYELDCVFPIDTEKEIREGMKIGFRDIDDDLVFFDVLTAEPDAFDDTVTLHCEHSAMAELLDDVIIDTRPTRTTAAAAVTSALAGSRWSIRTSVETEAQSCRFWYASRWNALKRIAEVWGVIVKFTWAINDNGIAARYVDVRSAEPTARGKRFVLNKDISALKVKYDDSDVATALIGRGRGEELETEEGEDPAYGRKISFKDVVWSKAKGDPADKPAGQEWVEDTEATALYGRSGMKRTKVITFDECEDPEELLALTWNALQQLNKPKVSIKATVSDLERLEGYTHEAIRINDKVAVIGDRVKVEIETTVDDVKRNYIVPEKTKITMGNEIITIADINSQNNAAIERAKQIAMLGDMLAHRNPGLIKGFLDTMVTQILSTGTNMYTDTTDGSLILENTAGSAAVKLTGNGILIANHKTAGQWEWTTALNGAGIVADTITSGTLQATLVRIFGNELFFWDALNIVCANPDNPNQQLRFGRYDGTHYGFAMTQDGGQSWQNCISFNGVTLQAGSVTRSMLDSELRTSLQTMGTALADLEDEVAAQATVYYSPTAPASPVAGDMWYDTTNHKIKRWGGESWSDVTSEALFDALDAAADAQSTADGKIRTFAQNNPPTGMATGDVGDLWIDTNDHNKLYRYSGSAWVPYQDDHYDQELADMEQALVDVADVVDGKTTVYYSLYQPAEADDGDIWYDLSDNTIRRLKKGATAPQDVWEDITNNALSKALTAAGTAQSTADGKIRTFAQVSAPTGMTATDVGDLWIDTDDSNCLYRWTGTAWAKVRDTYLDGTITRMGEQIAGISSTVNGKTTVWYSSTTPASPSDGDIWYDTANHRIERYNSGSWSDITTEALSQALDAAGTAQATADGKVRTFAAASAPTGMKSTDVGDLWVDTSNSNKLYRWNGSSWVSMQDTHLDQMVSTLQSELLGVSGVANGKTTIHYLPSQPTSPASGDLWYDTTTHKIKRYNGSAWSDITSEALYDALAAAGDAQSTADQKINSYAQDSAPTGLTAADVGDIWIETDNSNKMYRWNGSRWISIQDFHLDQRVTDVESKVTDEAIIQTVTSSTTYTTRQTAIDNGISGAQSTADDASSTALAAQSAANAAQTAVGGLSTRVGDLETWQSSASLKITDSAIVSTVTSSATYIADLDGTVKKVSVISSINQSSESIKLSASKISLEGLVTANNYFKVKEDGSIEAVNAVLSGYLTSGNWTFNSSGSKYTNGSNYVQMTIANNTAMYTTSGYAAQYGSNDYHDTTIYGSRVCLQCAADYSWAGSESISVQYSRWGSRWYDDICFVPDNGGSTFDSAYGNIGTTDQRWDVIWVRMVHYDSMQKNSSRTMKHDIQPMEAMGSVIDQLTPVTFAYNDDPREKTEFGLIYEDAVEVLPEICEAAVEGGQTLYGIDYTKLIPILLNEVKALRQRVRALEIA